MKIVNKIQNVIRYFAPHAFQNKVIISGGIPHILVTPEAYNDMAMLVGLANT